MRHAFTLAALLAATLPAGAQTVFEGRYGFETEYRFVDLSHTFAAGPYLEALYLGVPGQNELYLGVGYQIRPTQGVAFTPVLYGVFGKENDQAGMAFGGLLSVDRAGWKLLAFAGHFFRLEGEVEDYSFIDSLDLTRAIGRWELGVSTGMFATGGDASWLLGPTVKRNDSKGAWAAAARFGDDTEYRVLRVFVF
jgi:hypothetical protein